MPRACTYFCCTVIFYGLFIYNFFSLINDRNRSFDTFLFVSRPLSSLLLLDLFSFMIMLLSSDQPLYCFLSLCLSLSVSLSLSLSLSLPLSLYLFLSLSISFLNFLLPSPLSFFQNISLSFPLKQGVL